jgi:hypothetical protein
MGKQAAVVKPTVRQHYVPACYLARFTSQGRRDSSFFVHSLDGRIRPSTPNSEGFECHYHTINVEGLAPDHLETIFQKIESPACALFKTLSDNPGRSLTESDKDTLMMFFCVQAARLPQSRKNYDALVLDSARVFMEEMVYSETFFRKVTTIAAKHGIEVDSDPATQERLREAVERGHVFPYVGPSQSAVGMFRLTEAILDVLDGMHYTLWYSDGNSFVCSDYPVGLRYSLSADNPLEDPLSIEIPKVTLLDGSIFMPLAHNVAVVFHRIEGRPTEQRANESMVATVNAITVAHAQRFVCSIDHDFVCALPDRRIGNAKQTFEAIMSFT